MEEIYEANAAFNFEQLVLSPPISILGGNHFIKFSINENPLYIQSPKCTTKQGIIKAGKKLYCDLMMSNDHSQFIQWMENLENYSQEYIFKNRSKWFETDLEKHDIENSFSSPVKTYKSGKYYITRTNVPMCLGNCSLKIYDENEKDFSLENITDTTNIITILEIQGIKCSARSFQIEIELKQMMVLKPSKLFEKCIIKTHASIDSTDSTFTTSLGETTLKINDLLDSKPYIKESIQYSQDNQTTQINQDSPDSQEDDIFTTRKVLNIQSNAQPSISQPSISQPIQPIENTAFPRINEMTEIEFSLDELPENETIQIKKRNDVYYQMYREAKKKAKLARDLALSTYLDAKRIKNTYMLNEINEDSDLDEDDMNFEKHE